MNHILIKFLISLFVLNFSYSVEFEKWAQDVKNLIFNKNEIIKISFKAKIKSNNINLYDKNDDCYIILDMSKNIYQIEFSDNIIYYDELKMDHYNLNSHQFFRYKPDKIIVSFIEKITSDLLFDTSKYNSIDDSTYMYSQMVNKNDYLKVILNNNYIDIYYKNDIYDCTFNNINFETLDRKEYKKLSLYSVVDTNNIEIFNFMQ